MTRTIGREAREGRVREDVTAKIPGTKCAIDLWVKEEKLNSTPKLEFSVKETTWVDNLLALY